jgi:hypothetical protein
MHKVDELMRYSEIPPVTRLETIAAKGQPRRNDAFQGSGVHCVLARSAARPRAETVSRLRVALVEDCLPETRTINSKTFIDSEYYKIGKLDLRASDTTLRLMGKLRTVFRIFGATLLVRETPSHCTPDCLA